MAGTIPLTNGRAAPAAARRARRRSEHQAGREIAAAAIRRAGDQELCGRAAPTRVPATLRVTGGRRLGGRVTVGGSATATEFLLSAAAAIPRPIQLAGAPESPRIAASLALLTRCGWQVERHGSRLSVAPGRFPAETPAVLSDSGLMDIPSHLAPALLGARGAAVIPRQSEEPATLHELSLIFKAFGDEVCANDGGYAVMKGASAPAHVESTLSHSSQIATVTALIRAASAGVELTLGNPDTSPETVAVWDALTASGYPGAFTTQRLHLDARRTRSRGDLWRVPGDRIETMIYISALAATGGSGSISNLAAPALGEVRDLLERVGVSSLAESERVLHVRTGPPPRTAAWDGIRAQTATDPDGLDSLHVSMLLALGLARPGHHRLAARTATGVRDLKQLLEHLGRLGASYTLTGATAAFTGPQALSGTQILDADERSAAALLIAALTAAGTTVLTGADHLLLNHPRLIERLIELGAEIETLP